MFVVASFAENSHRFVYLSQEENTSERSPDVSQIIKFNDIFRQNDLFPLQSNTHRTNKWLTYIHSPEPKKICLSENKLIV